MFFISEEVIYSQESPKMEEFFRDFDWELNRFVEYRSPFTRKETLPNKLKNHTLVFRIRIINTALLFIFIRIGTEIVFDLK